MGRDDVIVAPVPSFLYGTAWKERETERLTRLAIHSGFRGIDTANQRKHYYEEGVGRALLAVWDQGVCTREELFLQTKYTFQRGQDERLPYDPRADLATQVQQSVRSSLEHLHTIYLDSYVLHGPSTRVGLTDSDWQVWKAMERLFDAGTLHRLGVSNVTEEQLRILLDGARVKPSFVQNRCYARLGWDAKVQEVCRRRGVRYQGFSLLTANREALAKPEIRALANELEVKVPQLVFAFARHLGMLPLTGTSDEVHMREDIESVGVVLTREQLMVVAKAGL